MTYALFWARLQQEFGGDINLQHRAAWERVSLDNKTPLTSQTWRQFCAEFELKGQRVEDKSEGEEYKLLFKQLPENWRFEVMKEESKRKSYHFWVRISNLHGVTPLDLQKNFQMMLNILVVDVKMVHGGYIVQCGSEENRRKPCSWMGMTLEGPPSKFLRWSARWMGRS